MHLGLSTYSVPWSVGVDGFPPPSPLSALNLLRMAAENKIRFVQFGDNLPLHRLSDEERCTLKQQANIFGIQIQVGMRGLQKENVLSYLRLASNLASPFLRVVTDDAAFHPTPEEVIAVIRDLLPHLQKHNIVLAIENHDRFSAQTLKEIINATDERWVGICLDTANSLGSGEGLKETVSLLAPYTVNLHVKDFIIQRVSHKMGFVVRGCPAGEGLLNIPELIEEIEHYKKCTTAILEVWSDPEVTIEQTVQKEKDWVAKSIQYLKTMTT